MSEVKFTMHGHQFTMDHPFKKMDPTIKAKWLEDLRSGKFKQGRFRLRDANDCLCCLGILCLVYEDNVGDTKYKRIGMGEDDGWHFGHGVNMPPDQVFRWAKVYIEYSDPTVEGVTVTIVDPNGSGGEHWNGNGLSFLTYLNDLYQWNFEQIADFVEAQL